MRESATALMCGITPWLSYSSKQLVEQLVQRPEGLCTVAYILDNLGLSNRHQLTRQLHRDGLPQFDELRGWIQVIGWVHAFEASNQTLSAIAKEVGKQPSALYRRVKQVTGMTWKRLVANGLSWVLNAFLKRCRVPKWYAIQEAVGTSFVDYDKDTTIQSTLSSSLPLRRDQLALSSRKNQILAFAQ